MAKILLYQAANHDLNIERTQPLGLMYVASVLRGAGHEVRLHDMRLSDGRFDLAEAALIKFDPDLVGVSGHSMESKQIHALAAIAKRFNPRAPVLAGGTHVTCYGPEALKDANIDAAVVGEGEATVAELVPALLNGEDVSGIRGVVYRNGDGRPVMTEARDPILEMDSLPHPAWDLIDRMEYYRYPRIGILYRNLEYMVMNTARACPYRCSFCHRTMGKVFRARSAESVVEEMKILRRDFGVREILVIDDMFNLHRERVHEICNRLIDLNLGLSLSFPTGIRGELLDEETVRLMKRAGTFRMAFAYETVTPRLQKSINKELDMDKIERMVRLCGELGIFTHGSFMIGLPTETAEEMTATVHYAARSSLHTVGVYRATPFAGTRMHAEAKSQGLPVREGEPALTFWDPTMNLSAVPVEFLNRLWRKAYREFYFRPKRIWAILQILPNKGRLLPLLARFFLKRITVSA